MVDEFFEFMVEGGKVGVLLDRIEGGVVAMVTLVFPDVNCLRISDAFNLVAHGERRPYQRCHNHLLLSANYQLN